MLKQIKTILLLSLLMMLALNACSPFLITSSEGEPSVPVVEVEPAATQEEGQPASVGGGETNGYTPLSVVDVRVEVNSDAANVIVGLDLPDSCAQLEYVKTVQDGATFFITLGTTPSQAEGCIQDTLPYLVSIPLNISDLPVGEYAVEANGVRGEFSVVESESTGELRTVVMPTYMDDVQINDLSIFVGVGSPIPVNAIVSGTLPKGCGQLGEAQIKRDGNTFFVRLISEMPTETECNPVGFSFRLELPLNIVNLPEGTYEVNVNGTVTTFNIPVQ